MSIFSAPAFDQHELVSFAHDKPSGLRAIIAVHSTALGSGVGGCRMFPYVTEADALNDVLRLSRGMTYKSALAGLPFGGAKAVIIGNPHQDKSRELLLAMGNFIHSQGGRYVSAEDSGTGVDDIRVMGERTPFVSGLEENGFGGDPSPSTAFGVYLAIRTAVKHRLGKESLQGLRVAVQGFGHVGFHLARLLMADGVVVSGADVNQKNLERAVKELGVIAVAPDKILSQEVDVFAPCAMGAVLRLETIETLRAGIVAGAANNQLATADDDAHLKDRGILYCPDFLINAGGIIDVHHQRIGSHQELREKHIRGIESRLLEVLRRSDELGKPTEAVAEELAKECLETVVLNHASKAA